jgi:hypothetical protein
MAAAAASTGRSPARPGVLAAKQHRLVSSRELGIKEEQGTTMPAELLELARRRVTAGELPKELTHKTFGGFQHRYNLRSMRLAGRPRHPGDRTCADGHRQRARFSMSQDIAWPSLVWHFWARLPRIRRRLARDLPHGRGPRLAQEASRAASPRSPHSNGPSRNGNVGLRADYGVDARAPEDAGGTSACTGRHLMRHVERGGRLPASLDVVTSSGQACRVRPLDRIGSRLDSRAGFVGGLTRASHAA